MFIGISKLDVAKTDRCKMIFKMFPFGVAEIYRQKREEIKIGWV
jgi:hypothetical protein